VYKLLLLIIIKPNGTISVQYNKNELAVDWKGLQIFLEVELDPRGADPRGWRISLNNLVALPPRSL